MECPICLTEWNGTTCIPRSLHCGHSFCEECLKAMIIKRNGLTCPTCNSVHKLPPQMVINPKTAIALVNSLAKNFSLLAIINEKQTKKLASSPMPVPKGEPTLPSIDDIENYATKCKGVCEKHGLAVHSYVLIPGNPLCCDKCVSELPKGTLVQPIPSIAKALMDHVTQVRNSIVQKKNDLKRYKTTIEKLFEKNNTETESNITEHFRRITELIVDAEKLVREKQKVVKAKQKENIDSYLVFFIILRK